MADALYVYAFGRELALDAVADELAVNGTSDFRLISENGIDAVCTAVDAGAFSQSAIDAHANDLQWLGVIGLSHQRVNEALARTHRTLPLRAFTLFTTEESLRAYLREQSTQLATVLRELEGRSEWTFRLEFDAQRWNDAIVKHVAELRSIEEEMRTANSGRAYLLKKKLDDAKKSAARTAEESLLRDVAAALENELGARIDIENRARRNGSFPQVNALVSVADAERVRAIERSLNARYTPDGVTITVTGPWPPYSFAGGAA